MINDLLHQTNEIQGEFSNLQISLFNNLKKKFNETEKFGFVHATPFLVDQKDNERYKIFYESLSAVIRRIVLAYSRDDELQQIIPLKNRARNLLDACSDEYRLGSLRPDFLLDREGNFKINEINARFPTNGFFISYGINSALNDVEELSKRGIIPLNDMNKVPSLFERLAGNITAIKESEPNWDISLYKEYLNSNGRKFSYVNPREIKLIDNRLDLNGENLESIVLELKQREIIQNCTPEFISVMQSHNHINDLRTILLVHDKRLLAVLSDDKLLKKYSTENEREVIKPGLIKTIAIQSYDDLKEEVSENKDEWVLKHALKGKGNQVYIGPELSEEEWKIACDTARKGSFVAQKYVNQKKFSIY